MPAAGLKAFQGEAFHGLSWFDFVHPNSWRISCQCIGDGNELGYVCGVVKYRSYRPDEYECREIYLSGDWPRWLSAEWWPDNARPLYYMWSMADFNGHLPPMNNHTLLRGEILAHYESMGKTLFADPIGDVTRSLYREGPTHLMRQHYHEPDPLPHLSTGYAVDPIADRLLLFAP